MKEAEPFAYAKVQIQKEVVSDLKSDKTIFC